MKRWAWIWVAFLSAAGLLPAQSGSVRSLNQPIPGATVGATQGGTRVVTTTDAAGRFTLPPLAPGSWTIDVTMFGFEPAQRVVNSPAAAERLDFNLRLKESPLAARAGRQGNTPQADSLLEAEIQNTEPAAPVQNNNETFLVSGSLSQGLANGAPADSGPGPQFGGRDGFAGGPDGGAMAQSPNAPGFGGGGPGGPFGGGPGGGPRGGGAGFGGPRRGGPGGGRPGRPAQFGNRRPPNQIRGMVFATLNNSALDAKPFSITGQDVSQPAYAQARFGIVAGGPLEVPKVFKDQSTFFFLSYFATRGRNPYTAVETLPTSLERRGDFSRSIQAGGPVSLYDPLTHQPIPGNMIPASRLDPIAQNLLGYFPLPNQPGLVNNYEFQTAAVQNTDNFALRLMRNLTSKDRFAYHIGFQRREGTGPQPFGFFDTSSGTGLTTDLNWTRTFSPTLISNARVSFNRNRNETVPFFANGVNLAAELGIAGASTSPLDYGPPSLNFTNFGALSDANPVLTRNQSQSAGDGLTLVRGKHTVLIGGQFTRNDLNTATNQNGRGTFNFTGLATSALSPLGAPLPGTGFDFADYLLGLPQSSSIRYGDSSLYFRQDTWNGYVQDEWKARADLTLTLGVRYDYFSPFTEKYGRMVNLAIAPGFTAVTPVIGSGILNPDRNNFGPRVGLAWRLPHIHRSTVLRAGYGIYYNPQAYNPFTLRLAQQPPFAVSNSVNTSPANVLTLADGFLATAPGDITNTYAVNQSYRTPYAQTWNLSIQHDLPAGFFLELGYLGTKGTRLDVATLPNEGPLVTAEARHQLGNAVGFTFDDSVGNSIYHALQVRAQRRFRSGISMFATYTFSKSIDDSSTFGGAGNTVAQDWLNLAAERGLSSFDRRHVLNLRWVWTSPIGSGRSRYAGGSLTGRLLKDWQLSGGITAETGTPLTARVLGNSAKLAQTGGIGSGRADATGETLASDIAFFNPAAFTLPPLGQFGNAGRNTIPGPGLFSLNLGFGRSFQLGDSRRRLELRMEAANALNDVSYTNINTVVNATNYGLPVSAASMRSVTAVLRFRF